MKPWRARIVARMQQVHRTAVKLIRRADAAPGTGASRKDNLG